MANAVNDIVEKLSCTPDLSGLGDVVEAIRATYDVDHVYYYAVSLGVDKPVFRDPAGGGMAQDAGIWRRDGRSLGAVSYSSEWIHHYFGEGYDAVDPVIRESANAFAPIDWSTLDWSDAPAKRMFHEAYESGVGNQGYTVPVRGPNGQFALFTVNKSCGSRNWDKLLEESKTDFMLLAHHTHQQALKLTGDAPTQNERDLSGRERDAVQLIATGLSRGQAAAKLGISENTFRVYIDSARHKLGALNIPHAVALATFKGVITP